MKVMIVDDDEDIRMVSEMSIREVGRWEVVVVASGEEALGTALREKPDVILLDVMMPGMDGFATLAKLRGQGATMHIPVIFLTAKVQKQEIESYQAAGAAGVIVKPFDPMRLPDQIRNIVNRDALA